jgi:hypothetical protein
MAFMLFAGFVAGHMAGVRSAGNPPAPPFATKGPQGSWSWEAPTYTVSGPRLYWQGWVMGNMREICEKQGMVFFVLFSIDNHSFYRNRRCDIDEYRDHELRCYLDQMAGAERFDKVYGPYARHLTGKEDLTPSAWREWWKTSGASFVFTPEILADYQKWLAPQASYQRWRGDPFEKLIEKEREPLQRQ